MLTLVTGNTHRGRYEEAGVNGAGSAAGLEPEDGGQKLSPTHRLRTAADHTH